MRPFGPFRGLPDRKLIPLLQGHQALHGRTFVWTVVALIWCTALTLFLGFHLAGLL